MFIGSPCHHSPRHEHIIDGMNHIFPFGQPLGLVQQTDRRPKQVFVLGVYASAVHARWVGADGRDIVKALAVASEPYIFWKGDGADEIISRIAVHPKIGRLYPADQQLNGPSGLALDELFLKPLELGREDAWLCDLVPHSCVNPAQQEAIERAYLPLMATHGLPTPTIPPVPNVLADEDRVRDIAGELEQSRAQTLVLLGDEPIKWFLRAFDQRWRNLASFGTDAESYGRRHRVVIGGREIDVLPLAHPRQVARLGRASARWYELHCQWCQANAMQ